MNIEDATVPRILTQQPFIPAVRPVTAAGEMEQQLAVTTKADRIREAHIRAAARLADREPEKRVIFLYDPVSGTSISKPFGRQPAVHPAEAHLGGVED